MTPFTFSTTRSIISGSGKAAEIGPIARLLLGERVLLVTDAGLRRSGLLEPSLASLLASGITMRIFDEVVADPPEAIVRAAAAAAAEHAATGILAIGGGSPMDVAKLAALLARSDEKLADIYGVGNVKGPRLPLMLVPTTAGTGSEVTPISIVTTGEAEKKGVVSPILLPDAALLDPELTLGLPPAITAATGVDAMVHAIEAYASASPNNNPVSRALAREALRLLGANIREAVHNGRNRDARGAMLLGSLLAGQAFANSPVAAVHALAYPLGGHYHIPHGLSNALVLPHVLAFNLPAAALTYGEIAADAFPELGQAPVSNRAERFVESLASLSVDLNLPTRLRDMGIGENALAMLATDAMKQTRLLVNNPRPLTEADALAIYRAAW
ncbi:MAG: iron-containing alcohol dehydrogenase [Methylocystis sp.]|nr:iron-containing alcohol dehydrogenase [Methylocystis sp.]MCA3582602.1 iron-containing alcohol dehydrogenase [Methylocystis sp.]MCA3589588.1 iron-containing alcohol dehydrogenase [Methylocystis sp.]MCA3591725.1 iron-containing alcohol dehydrogenase [Methylocystis sp.]